MKKEKNVEIFEWMYGEKYIIWGVSFDFVVGYN